MGEARKSETPAKKTARAWDLTRGPNVTGSEATVYCAFQKLEDLADLVESDLAPGRALSCFLTKLEEAAMWLREAARA